MKRWPVALVAAVVLTAVFAIQGGLLPERAAAYPDAKGDSAVPMVGHMVFFTLKDSTPGNREKLVSACDKYLADHDGVAYYSAGAIAEDGSWRRSPRVPRPGPIRGGHRSAD